MERELPITANIQTSPVILDPVEAELLQIGAPIEDTLLTAEAFGNRACQLENDKCRLKLESTRQAGTLVLAASCKECPNPENTFDTIQSVRSFARARLESVKSTMFPDEIPSKGEAPQITSAREEPRAEPDLEELKGYIIEELELGVGSYNTLKRAGCQTIFDVVSMTEEQLRALPNIGRRADEIIMTLGGRGLSLTNEDPEEQARKLAPREDLSHVDVSEALNKLGAEIKAYTQKHQELEQNSAVEASQVTHHELEKNANNITQALYDAMGGLSYREKRIIELRYGLDGNDKRTRAVVGEEFSISSERVRQIENQTLKNLQSKFSNNSIYRK